MKKATQRRIRRRVTSAAIVLAVLLFLIFIFRGHASRTFALVQRPFVAAGTWVTDRASILSRSGRELAARAEELEGQRNALAIDYAELETLRAENEQLKNQLSFVSRQSEQSVTAAIVSRSSTNRTSTFVIDRGERDGVRIGAPVIVGTGYLVGKVTSTTPATATVTATTDTTMATAATLLNESRTIGIAEGLTGRLIALQFIPHDEELNINDLVVTSGLEDGVPSGLIIGIVNTVASDETLPFQEAVVEPLIDISQHRIVSILIPSL